MADPMFNKPARIDILIGAEIFFDLLSIGRIYLNERLPILQKSILGWIVAGKAEECLAPSHKINNMLVNHNHNENENLSQLVEKFWKIEQISTKSNFLTEEEEECKKIFRESIRRDTSGRFITKIPFKTTVSDLGGSYNAAKRRLLSLERRLSRDRSTRDAYNAFMDEYLSLGHMTIVEEADMDKIKYFAPHQYVLRPDSTSTKLRVVFDCSCKTDSGLSLNEVMMKGPLVQDDLLSIILRFRCYKYAITADVTKMYRQAWVTDDDANYQTILWRSSSDENIKAYRLRTITYGTTSAPYLATRYLKQLSEDYIDKYPIGSRKVLSDFYMDDLISGSNDEDEIFEIYNQVSAIMNSAKFKLRKWFSNSEKFLNFVPEADKEKTLRMNDEEIIKTLGIIWAPVGDTFRYVWPDFDSSKAVTKRIVLSELSKLFDPLGLINPLIVKAKIFMQDLWILKANWDESLPMNLHSQWIEFRENLKDVKKISVPRFVLAEKRVARVEMHGFADASKRAFGCCIYIRSICVDNDVTMQLWSAKSRIAPLKTLSLPKLELLAAELLSKLVTKTKSNFPISIDATYLWVDSEIVLDWLSEHPSNWNTFVANRVSLIQEQTKTCIWRHVPSKSNPADIISRGAYVDELSNSICVKSMTERLDEALVRIFYCVQQHYFKEEIELLLKNRELPANSKYKNLSIFVEDTYGVPLLRVDGRLAKAALPYDAKHQI
ncbi:uncharacterized protein LOC119667632 [Teleopsis dalmanni]|uniref:uncharacterized protein LOC119667632 n=1 Tax=Teleopsis dalmanni TaxID=139649 RepID=UPI0018CE04F4|nr:uncharacterized protein LOC119667632 [Teleopsis dalmanni]